MKEIIGLVDYGKAGNCHSVEKALLKAGGNVRLVSNCEELSMVDKIVLPGVGSFADGVMELKEKGLFQQLQKDIPNKPTLGICLGMQLLSEKGFELGSSAVGLGCFDTSTERLDTCKIVPHVGFNSLLITKSNPLLNGLNGEEFYFMHSNVLQDSKDTIAKVDYENGLIVSAVSKNQVYGVQFHPEKSRDAGIQLFKNFLLI